MNYFVMRRSKMRAIIVIVGVIIIVGSLTMVFNDVGWMNVAPILPVLFGAFLVAVVFLAICDLVWKCTVHNEEIHLRTLFYSRTFTFSDVKWVHIVTRLSGDFRATYGGVALNSGHGGRRLLFVTVHTSEYDTLVQTLKIKKIHGADNIPNRF